MKNIFIKSTFFIIYISLLLWIVDFNYHLIVDLKALFIVIFGTILLTLFGYKKVYNKKRIIELIKWNLQFTGFISTFMAQVAYLSNSMNSMSVDFFTKICTNFLPLVYSFIFFSIIDAIFSSDKKDSSSTTSESNQMNCFLMFESYDLTKAERAVAEKILLGLSNKEISAALLISENTVKKHLQNIYKKTSSKNRNQLMHLALSNISSEEK